MPGARYGALDGLGTGDAPLDTEGRQAVQSSTAAHPWDEPSPPAGDEDVQPEP